MTYTATYSPDDNKLRLYATARLDSETYAKAKALGFRWAPKQELFVAPAWTPAREDFLLGLAGEIDDEDKSLVERAEERAERFEDYGERRAEDAERAREAVAAIADNIPLGQPILVGHHSEKHARRDAERVEGGMRRAVKMWETSKYWTARAAGAVAAAKYKELPGVRHRRIKALEAEKRKAEKSKSESETWLKLWTACGDEPDAELRRRAALKIAGACWLHLPRKEGDREDFAHTPTAHDALTNAHPALYAPRTLDEVVAHAKKVYPANISHYDRWLAHLDNRLAYERAMLGEQIGTNGELGAGMGGRFDIKPGGKVLTDRGWLIVVRVNKSGAAINSVTTQSGKCGIEKVMDYQPPTEEMAARVKKVTTQPPICNYPGDGFREMTEVEWKGRKRWSDFPYLKALPGNEVAGRHRVRQMPGNPWYNAVQVFLTDAKRVDPPKPEPSNALPPPEKVPRPGAGSVHKSDGGGAAFDAMRASLKAGVSVVAAPQLFPTPAEVGDEMVALANLEPWQFVLEPSAGTGALLDAIRRGAPANVCATAVEVNEALADGLRRRLPGQKVLCCDFLKMVPDAGSFDRVIMNPPFENAIDIKHVEHALKFLAPGGRLVAIVAGGPRQERAFRDRASHWEELPSGAFAGTGVRSVLMAIDKEANR